MQDWFFAQAANPQPLESFGFRFGEIGTHTSRTIMVDELTALFAHTSVRATREDYAVAIVNENCLGKETHSTRRLTNQRMGELYGLDLGIPLFRVFRWLWAEEVWSPALLALLVSLARDPLLRATAQIVTGLPEHHELPRSILKSAIASFVGERMNDGTVDKVLRNAASSWTQSGHLAGRTFKQRREVHASPGTVALALLLGTMAGFRGSEVFSCPWIKVLDCAGNRARELALEAKRQGFIDIRIAGEVVDLDFKRLDPEGKGVTWVA